MKKIFSIIGIVALAAFACIAATPPPGADSLHYNVISLSNDSTIGADVAGLVDDISIVGSPSVSAAGGFKTAEFKIDVNDTNASGAGTAYRLLC